MRGNRFVKIASTLLRVWSWTQYNISKWCIAREVSGILQFRSKKIRVIRSSLQSLEEMTLHVKSVPPRHGRENNDCRTDDPLERVPGIVVARACRVCVTLGRSTTPPCFLLECIPPPRSPLPSMHTRTWDEREHAWRMIYYYWDEGGTKGDGRERGVITLRRSSFIFVFREMGSIRGDQFRNEFYLVLGKNWFNFISSRLLTVRNIFFLLQVPATLIETRKIMESLVSCINILFSRNWMWKGLTRKRSHDKSPVEESALIPRFPSPPRCAC